ncbi:hypothetical protein Syun_022242 [Stephania yunnanensis]|uniref:MARVEL domain-containing protein n=1 Tax=Stephania yunnanensis TaxID=152371 RepID=A0AAP0IHK8_9MAGN
MAVSVSILAVVTSLHLIAFVLAVGAERRRSTGKVVPDRYDESTFCVYDTDVSTAYGLTAFGLLLISHAVVNGVTRCLCFARPLLFPFFPTLLFLFSWIVFLGAEACLLAGSARNAYHTKYRGLFGVKNFSCATLRKGVFAAAAAITLISMLASILYYWAHNRADTGGWHKHRNEGLHLTSTTSPQQKTHEFEKA